MFGGYIYTGICLGPASGVGEAVYKTSFCHDVIEFHTALELIRTHEESSMCQPILGEIWNKIQSRLLQLFIQAAVLQNIDRTRCLTFAKLAGIHCHSVLVIHARHQAVLKILDCLGVDVLGQLSDPTAEDCLNDQDTATEPARPELVRPELVRPELVRPQLDEEYLANLVLPIKSSVARSPVGACTAGAGVSGSRPKAVSANVAPGSACAATAESNVGAGVRCNSPSVVGVGEATLLQTEIDLLTNSILCMSPVAYAKVGSVLARCSASSFYNLLCLVEAQPDGVLGQMEPSGLASLCDLGRHWMEQRLGLSQTSDLLADRWAPTPNSPVAGSDASPCPGATPDTGVAAGPSASSGTVNCGGSITETCHKAAGGSGSAGPQVRDHRGEEIGIWPSAFWACVKLREVGHCCSVDAKWLHVVTAIVGDAALQYAEGLVLVNDLVPVSGPRVYNPCYLDWVKETKELITVKLTQLQMRSLLRVHSLAIRENQGAIKDVQADIEALLLAHRQAASTLDSLNHLQTPFSQMGNQLQALQDQVGQLAKVDWNTRWNELEVKAETTVQSALEDLKDLSASVMQLLKQIEKHRSKRSQSDHRETPAQ
ncbi:hypothetical protein GNI_067010, partial [Gregarina niphandrodes]